MEPKMPIEQYAGNSFVCNFPDGRYVYHEVIKGEAMIREFSKTKEHGVLSAMEAAEVTKIFGEINQLRNQQFLITGAALTFFGAGLARIIPNGNTRDLSSLETQWTSWALQVIFLILFLWLHTLSRMITRLSVYLEVRFSSRYEKHHANFHYSGSAKPRMRAFQVQAMASVFLALTLLTACGTCIVNHIELSMDSFQYIFPLAGFSAVNLIVIWKFSRDEADPDREGIRTEWMDIIGRDGKVTQVPYPDPQYEKAEQV
jgi:hypothetical protein